VASSSIAVSGTDIGDRCEIVGGDFFGELPQRANGYLMANVLHDWDDTRAIQILANCRRAMARHSKVLIVERLIPDDVGTAVPVLLSDINMLVFSGGRERTNADYETLLNSAGMNLGRVQPVASPYGVVEGFIS
jgi:O-methyltransferase domain